MVIGASVQAATVFSFQQGDLRRDGLLHAAGASYSGMLDGSVTDNAPNNSMVAITTDRIGNQNRATNANVGTNGQQWTGLFSIDLTELFLHLEANSGQSVSEVSFNLTRLSSTSGGVGLQLYQTEPFMAAATWATSNGTDAWSTPLADNPGGVAGGGTRLSGPLNGTAVGTFGSANSAMVFSSSESFVGAVESALARPDRTLYLIIQPNSAYNSDHYASFINNEHATTDLRPELAITLIPEPSSALLLPLGLLLALRRHKRGA
jgi:hypothetical protein